MLDALVIDDEPMIRELIQETLQAAGWRVQVAGDADEACALVLAGRAFDVAVVDVNLAGVRGGLELCRQLSPERPVLLVSGFMDDQIVAAGRAAGALGFLPKPFRPVELLETLERLAQAPRADRSR